MHIFVKLIHGESLRFDCVKRFNHTGKAFPFSIQVSEFTQNILRSLFFANTLHDIDKKFGKSLSDYKDVAIKNLSAADRRDYNTLKKAANFNKNSSSFRMFMYSIGIAFLLYFVNKILFVLSLFGVLAYGYDFLKNDQGEKDEKDRITKEGRRDLDQFLKQQEEKYWLEDLKKFRKHPENEKIAYKYINKADNYLQELNSIDFSDYKLLPEFYQDNVSVHRAYKIIASGQAVNWQQCAQLLEKNAEADLVNAANLENINQEIEEFEDKIADQSSLGESELDELTRKKSKEIFSNQRVKYEQITSMKKSLNDYMQSI